MINNSNCQEYEVETNSILASNPCVFFIEDSQMALSSSERLRLILEESNRFVDRRRVRDASELTAMNQAKASGTVFTRNVTPARPYITNGVTNKSDFNMGLHTNGIGSNAGNMTVSTFTIGASNFGGFDAINQAAQKCAVCSDVDLSQQTSTRIDMLALGAIVAYDHTKFPFSQNTAALTGFSSSVTSCAPKSNFQRFFPTNAQPNPECCTDTPQSLISMKFGSAGV